MGKFTAIRTSTRQRCSARLCSFARVRLFSSPDKYPASKATSNPSRPVSPPDATPRNWLWASPCGRFRARPLSDRCALTSPEPMRAIISRPISRSISCPRSTTKRGGDCGTTKKPGTPQSAAGRPINWTSFAPCMPELKGQIDRFLDELRRQNASLHTLRNYASDLAQLLDYFTVPGGPEPAVEKIDALWMLEWLAHLYQQRLTAVSMRRKLAAVRSFFKFLLRDGVVAVNVARMVRTPKAPKSLPRVMTAEQTNTLVDGVAADKFERPYPGRDLAIFELLYGCRLRISELAGLHLGDFDFRGRSGLVRPKGRQGRDGPLSPA